jgi:L-rhamnose mutarotase
MIQRRLRYAPAVQRMAFRMRIQPGTDDEYLRRHQEVWPEMLDALRRAGFLNYSIYRDGTDLFAFFEAEDVRATISAIVADPTNTRWAAMMADILVTEIDPASGFPASLPEQFHLD